MSPEIQMNPGHMADVPRSFFFNIEIVNFLRQPFSNPERTGGRILIILARGAQMKPVYFEALDIGSQPIGIRIW